MYDVVQVCSQIGVHDHTFVANILIQMFDGVHEQMYDRVDGALTVK